MTKYEIESMGIAINKETNLLYALKNRNLPRVLVLPDEVDGVKVEGVEAFGFNGVSMNRVYAPKDFKIGDSAFFGTDELIFDGDDDETYGAGMRSRSTRDWDSDPVTAKELSRRGLRFSGFAVSAISDEWEDGGDLIIPTSVDGVRVRRIEVNGFYKCTQLKSIKIPGCVDSIGERAFQLCTNLKTVVIEDGLTFIGPAAFVNCTSLEKVILPESLLKIDERVFSYCVKLTSIDIPNTVACILSYSFMNCIALNLTVPSTVTSIAPEAFCGILSICYNGPSFGSPWGAKSVSHKS